EKLLQKIAHIRAGVVLFLVSVCQVPGCQCFRCGCHYESGPSHSSFVIRTSSFSAYLQHPQHLNTFVPLHLSTSASLTSGVVPTMKAVPIPSYFNLATSNSTTPNRSPSVKIPSNTLNTSAPQHLTTSTPSICQNPIRQQPPEAPESKFPPRPQPLNT